VLALQGDGDGEVDVGEQADGGPAVPGLPADDLPGVQARALLGKLVIFFASSRRSSSAVHSSGRYNARPISACPRPVA